MFKKYFQEVEEYFINKEHEAVPSCYLCSSYKNEEYHKKLKRCLDCEFVWLGYQPTEKVLQDFYDKSLAMNTWSKIKQGDDGRQNDKFSFFWHFIRVNGIRNVLDVGCGNGKFLDGLPRGVSGIGVEPNKDAARHCNVPIVTPEQIKDKFDFISLFGVLEHLKDPRKVLSEYMRFAHRGTRFAFIVPNISSMAFQVLKEDNATICPQHLWYFSIDSLCNFMKEFKMQLVTFKTVETEYQPIVRKLTGLHPYEALNDLELEHPIINEKDILDYDLGAKILAIFEGESCQSNTLQ